MKRSLGILRVLLIGAIGVTGCGEGPTSPGDQGSGVSPELDLTGTWTGTATDYLGSCQPEPFTVDLIQGGTEISGGLQVTKVSGDFSTPCQGSFSIRGSLSKGNLFGNIAGKGRIQGSATSSAIQITVIGGSGGLEGGQLTVCRLAMQK